VPRLIISAFVVRAMVVAKVDLDGIWPFEGIRSSGSCDPETTREMKALIG
jgi:hypothetical protein